NMESKGVFYLEGDTVDMVTNIKNVGNADITSSIAVQGTLRVGTSNFWTDNTMLDSLLAGIDMTVTFPNAAILSVADRYTYVVNTVNNQDLNPSNNENTVEVNVVACKDDTVNYAYGTGPADGAILWNGGQGNEGGGVYIEPAVYPTIVEAIDVFIADVDQMPGSDGFSVTLHDANGLPGLTLDSISIAAANVVEGAWTRIPLTTPITINSGGFYVGWYQGGANVGLGTEGVFPISKRAYEILSGQWAPYRQLTVADPLLGVHTTATCPLVGIENGVETNISVEANPNPSKGLTMIRFEIPALGDASLTVSNMFGQTIFTEVQRNLAAGAHEVKFDTQDLASGVYFINLTFGDEKVTQKLVVNR
ncbi:MAG TPA: T9SS type A sorting domain-containing protein, partial [Bacteroidetes bacterium]|nr:T9SS type A sorting domain-containing protein [Bacteroidota bacterium]